MGNARSVTGLALSRRQPPARGVYRSLSNKAARRRANWLAAWKPTDRGLMIWCRTSSDTIRLANLPRAVITSPEAELRPREDAVMGVWCDAACPPGAASGVEGDVDAKEDPDDEAGQADSRQHAAAMRVGVLADEAVVRESDVIDGG